MNPSNVPEFLVHLLPLAEIWGLGDDIEREALVEDASLEDLREMLSVVDEAEDAGLYDWLSGDESFADPPSTEYLAITCLTMAADAGRLRLELES